MLRKELRFSVALEGDRHPVGFRPAGLELVVAILDRPEGRPPLMAGATFADASYMLRSSVAPKGDHHSA
ncbi:hypothetical protein J8N05_32565 [Streptomyces sp. BH-SS-21]|uniref:Uncharacterized protein n=1 Tax=Streptomyces liliiviolaceus TaxID=2823109 RepID=A0A940Y006_9ACTN|nr:hypothetical protein [Streptomyces liliiviolaceus]MBQ0852905.1 hypothetical protein [Streptomyces liliiviolaceus]